MKPETWLEALNCAVEGILRAVKTQRHMRWHVLSCFGILVLAPALDVSGAEFALLCLAAGGVVVAELLNTSIEAAVDLASPEYHPGARVAKDVAAGAVLVGAFVAVAVGWVVLFPRIGGGAAALLERANRDEPVAAVAVLLAVLVLVIGLKARLGRGTPLHGGFPSGHAAVAFAGAVLIALKTRDATAAALAVLMALMVSHSRLLLKVHTPAEVAGGAALGALVSVLLYWLVY